MYEQYTDEQIVEMLKPKLAKLGWEPEFEPRMEELISTLYKSGYIRGQLGRSFIIGEKKANEKKTKESVNTFKVGDKVKFLDFNIEDEEALNNRRFFPLVNTIGEVVESGLIYCVVRWPKGVTSGDGIWGCRNIYLEKITEHWVPAIKDNVKVGSTVRMIDEEIHNTDPAWFPVVGTLGITEKVDYNSCLIQWPEDTTYGDGKLWSKYERLEVLLCE